MLVRLGFPPIGRHRRFVTALAIDAIGSGVWMPFEMLFFLKVTPLTLTQVGSAASVGALISIPTSVAIGPVVDRYGPKRVLLAANLILATTFGLSPLVDAWIGVVVVAAAMAASNSLFWAAFQPMVTAISPPGEREKWFGFLGALRNVGFAVGGLGAGVVLTIDTLSAFIVGAYFNAASYLISFLLLLGVTTAYAVEGSDKEPSAPSVSLLTVLRDVGYRWFWLANLGFALSCLVLNTAIPIYLVRIAGLPGWVAGAGYVMNTVLIGFGQGLLVQRMTGHARSRILQWGWLAFAIGFAGLAAAQMVDPGLGIVIALAAIAVYTLGEMIGSPVLATIGAEAPPPEARGRYAGFYQLSWNLAVVTAPGGFAFLLTHDLMWPTAVAVVAVAAMFTAVMGSRLPAAAAAVTNTAHG